VNALFASVAAYTALGVLLASGAGHVRGPGRFRRLLARQDVFPRSLHWPIAASVITVELALPAIFSVSLVVGSPGASPARAVLIGTGALYLVFGAHALYLWKRRPGAPCACSSSDSPATSWTVVRAGCLGVLAFVGATLASETVADLGSRFVVASLAALAIGVITWNLPGALYLPQRQRSDVRVAR
jgi:hypothetical protein